MRRAPTLKTTNMKICNTNRSRLMIVHKEILIDAGAGLNQGQLHHLLHSLDIIEFKPLDKGGIDLLHIFFILPAENDLL